MKKAEEYKGKRVRLRYDITTKGGQRFPKGTVMHVTYVERGKLALCMRNPDQQNIFGPRWLVVRLVGVDDVEIVTRRQL